jgi:peptide/nickel transport system substrate-binding protein
MQTFDSRLFRGDFDLAYYGETGGPTPYYEMRRNMYSKNTAPLGTDAGSNYERYKNPAVDALFDQYPTASDADQISIMKKIERYMLDDIPVIPTTEGVDWFQYNTAKIGGWPTKDDPYAQPSAFSVPDVGQVLTHIYSKSG